MSVKIDPSTTFISYARENETFARQLYNDLTAAGVRPWLDRYDIPPGAIWDDEIQRGLNDVSHVLVIVSSASVASQNVHDEWNYAITLGKTLIPLIHEQLDQQKIPYRLQGYNWVIFAGQDYDTALKHLLTVLPITAAPNPLAAPEPSTPVPIPTGQVDLVAAAAAWKHGNAEFHDGNLQAAMNAYSDAIRLAPQHPEAYIHRGMVLYYLERYQDALQDFIRAQQLNPDIPLLYNNRGVTYLALKNVALALADYAEAILLNPAYANAYYNRAQTYMAIRRFRLALNDYNRAIEINNRVPLFYSSRGLVYAEQGLYEQAIADYNRAIELDERHIAAFGNRANAYANMGRTAEALADYDRVIALDPEHVLAYAGRSEIAFCAGNYTQAALDASTIIGLQPNFHGGYALRALADFRRNKREDALKHYAKAIQLDSAWKTPEGAAAYLTICPEQALQTVRDMLRQ